MEGRVLHLLFLAENRLYNKITAVLKTGRPGLWGDMERDGFERCFYELKQALKHEQALMGFVELAIVTEARCFPDRVPPWLFFWIKKNIFSDFSEKEEWHRIFIPLVDSRNNAGDFCMVVGTFTSEKNIGLLPEWAMPLLDNGSKSAVKTAETAARSFEPEALGSLIVYPLLAPNGRVQITGSSLGLPLALLFLSLMRKSPLNLTVTATGRITRKGEIHETGGVDLKLRLAASRGFKLFLSPAGILRSPGPGIEVAAVSTLDQAWLFAKLISQNSSRGISTLKEMMGSGRAFAANLGICDLALLETAVKLNFMDMAIEELQLEREAFETFSSKLVDPGMQNISHGEREFLSSLVSLEAITENSLLADHSVVKFLTFLIHVANARGKTEKCDRLSAEGIRRLNRSVTIPVETRVDFFNNQLVSWHNLYCFDPEPEALNLGKSLEAAHGNSIKMGTPIDPLYGRFCGTLSQHFGFCGQSYIDNFITWHKRALNCFGRFLDSTCQYRMEWLRQYGYAVYAYLDAGMKSEAGASLCDYLEIKSLEGIPEKMHGFSCWHHAAIARFFADTGDLKAGRNYLSMALIDRKIIPEPTHPWQLWYSNCGRIAMHGGEDERAEELFKKSIGISMAENNGPAIRVMALLPLYELAQKARLGAINDLESLEQRIRAGAGCLDPHHFAILKKSATLDALFKDKDFSLQGLFPFSTR